MKKLKALFGGVQKPREFIVGLIACTCFSIAGFQYSTVSGFITMGGSALLLDIWMDREKKP